MSISFVRLALDLFKYYNFFESAARFVGLCPSHPRMHRHWIASLTAGGRLICFCQKSNRRQRQRPGRMPRRPGGANRSETRRRHSMLSTCRSLGVERFGCRSFVGHVGLWELSRAGAPPRRCFDQALLSGGGPCGGYLRLRDVMECTISPVLYPEFLMLHNFLRHRLQHRDSCSFLLELS